MVWFFGETRPNPDLRTLEVWFLAMVDLRSLVLFLVESEVLLLLLVSLLLSFMIFFMGG